LTEAFLPYIDRPLTELNPVELAIMRIGVYELLHRHDIPYRVIINEALELAKKFGAEEGHKYVNGILDKVARDARVDEIAKEI
jgi:N utilization substance protein B